FAMSTRSRGSIPRNCVGGEGLPCAKRRCGARPRGPLSCLSQSSHLTFMLCLLLLRSPTWFALPASLFEPNAGGVARVLRADTRVGGFQALPASLLQPNVGGNALALRAGG